MSDSAAMHEVKALIRWYERRGKNWLMAAEYTLLRHNSGGNPCLHSCWICIQASGSKVRVQPKGKP